MALSLPTNDGLDYPARVGLLFNAFNNGNYAFPATQVPSADANTLDDYEEGTWTPALTFATPGDLSVAYSALAGTYTKVGRVVHLQWTIATSTFTHTTASGSFSITGVPFANSSTANRIGVGSMYWQGITKANYTQMTPIMLAGASAISIIGSGSGQAIATIATGDMPTAGTVYSIGQLTHSV
jgi:hypothetical protein